MSNPVVGQVFQTRFGMFVPCDWATYKRIKRVRHLATFAEVMARRWTRAQRRLPKNRYFRRERTCVMVSDAMLFERFWQRCEEGGMARAEGTELWRRFMEDYGAARRPVGRAEEVKAMQVSAEELAQVWLELEAWHERVFLRW